MSLTNSSFYILNDGTVKTCGYNNYGQLGLGNTTNITTPTIIPDLDNVKQISCGRYHTLFLLNDGTVKSCGQNSNGQLGLGDTTNRTTPTLIPDLDNVQKLLDNFDMKYYYYYYLYNNTYGDFIYINDDKIIMSSVESIITNAPKSIAQMIEMVNKENNVKIKKMIKGEM